MIKIKTINDDIMDLLKKLIKYTEDYKIIWTGDFYTNVFTSKEYFSDNSNQSYLFTINKKNETQYMLIFTVTDMGYKTVSEKYCIADITICSDVNGLLENLFNLIYDRCHNVSKYNTVCSLINAFKAIDKDNEVMFSDDKN